MSDRCIAMAPSGIVEMHQGHPAHPDGQMSRILVVFASA